MSEDVLEMSAGIDGPQWAEKVLSQGAGKSNNQISELDSSLFNLALYHLQRERQLGAARSDLTGMLIAAESLLTIREKLLSRSLPHGQRQKLLAVAEASVRENCFEIPPFSALIKSVASEKKISTSCQRIAHGFTVLLLTAAPQKTEITTILLSHEVKSILYI